MSLTFPRTDILTGVPLSPSGPAFKPMWRQETSRTAGGVTLVKALGPLLWSASYMTAPLRSARASEVEADLLSLENGARLFEGYDPRHPLPASDQTSSLASVTVHEIATDRMSMRLAGLPEGFVISRGDWVSIDDGVNLHLVKAVEESIAGSTGLSIYFEVRPGLRSSIQVGDPVKLRYAPARFMVDPGSVERSPAGALHETVAWTATQVIT